MKKIFKIIIIVGCILLVALLVFLISRKKVIVKDDIENYNKYLEKLKFDTDVHSKLFIFPEKINKDEVEGFEYLKVNSMFNSSYMFYLVVKYNEKEYFEEENRIKSVNRIFRGGIKYPIYVDKLKYPTYVTISDGHDTYEYVLLDKENNKIVYVFKQLYFYENKLNKEYLVEYQVPRNKRDNKKMGYNMYYYYDENGNSKLDY